MRTRHFAMVSLLRWVSIDGVRLGTGIRLVTVCLAASATLVGCTSLLAGGPVGLKILTPATGEEVVIRSGQYREVILDVADRNRGFFTIARQGDALLLRHRDNEGGVVATAEIPLFDKGYASGTWLAVDPGFSRVVFFDEATGSLMLMRFGDRVPSRLEDNVTQSSVYIHLIEWLSDHEVVLVTKDEISVVDVETGKRRVKQDRFRTVPAGCQVSPDRKYLGIAYGPNVVSKVVRVLRLRDMEFTCSVPLVEPRQSIGSMRWMDVPDNLIYVVSTDTSDGIYRYHIGDAAPTKVRDLQAEERVLIMSAFGNSVLYKRWTPDEAAVSVLLDMQTGQSTEIGRMNGWAYALDDGKKVVMEVGY